VVVGRRNEGRTPEAWKSDEEFIREVKALGGVSDVVCSPRFPNVDYQRNMLEYAKYVTSA